MPLDPRTQRAWEYAIDPSLTAEEAQMRVAELWNTPDPVQQVIAGQEAPTLVASNEMMSVPTDPVSRADVTPSLGIQAAGWDLKPAEPQPVQTGGRSDAERAAVALGLSAPVAEPVSGQPVPGVIPVGGVPQTPSAVTTQAGQPELSTTQDIASDLTSAQIQGALLDNARKGGVTVIPGGERLKQFQIEKGPELTPEQEQAIRDQAGREADLTQQGYSVTSQTAAANAEQQQAAAERVGDQLIDFKLGQQKAQQDVDKQRKQVDQLTDEAKYNPHAFWEDRGVFGNMLSMIGFAMMGAGGASAKDIIGIVEGHNKEDLQNKLRKRDGAQSKLDELSQGVLNPAAMNEYAMGIKLKQAAFEMDAMATTMRSKELQQQGFLEAEKVRQEAERRIMSAQQLESGSRTENWINEQRRVVGGGRQLSTKEVIAKEAARIAKERGQPFEVVLAELLKDSPTLNQDKKEKGREGWSDDDLTIEGVGVARTPKDAEDIKNSVAGLADIRRNVKIIEDIVKAHGTETIGENAGKIDSAMASIAGAVKSLESLGTLDAGVERLISQKFGDPKSFWTGNDRVLAQLQSGLADVEGQFRSKVRTRIKGGHQATGGDVSSIGRPAD